MANNNTTRKERNRRYYLKHRDKFSKANREYREEVKAIEKSPRCQRCEIILGSPISGGDGIHCDRCLIEIYFKNDIKKIK